ncbi:MAG: ribosome recycling factor [Planctomycetota bacterium]
MSTKTVTRDCKERMDKSVSYFESELRGIRTGRATTALIDYVKVDYYGSSTDLKDLAAISVPEPTQLLVKPFDPQSVNDIVKAIEAADLGLNPQADSGSIRINVPPPSAERRQQLVAQVKRMAEDARVAIRNERRDAIKQVDALVKDKTNGVSEDDGKHAKDDIDGMTKKHVSTIDTTCDKKSSEIQEVG